MIEGKYIKIKYNARHGYAELETNITDEDKINSMMHNINGQFLGYFYGFIRDIKPMWGDEDDCEESNPGYE